MGLYFFERRTPPYMIKKDGRMNLKENLFPHMGMATLLEWLLVS